MTINHPSYWFPTEEKRKEIIGNFEKYLNPEFKFESEKYGERDLKN